MDIKARCSKCRLSFFFFFSRTFSRLNSFFFCFRSWPTLFLLLHFLFASSLSNIKLKCISLKPSCLWHSLSFVAASPIPTTRSSLTLERAHVDDMVLGESAFEKRSPRFMPPGHGPGPVVQPSLKNAIVASAKAFVNMLKGKEALQARGLEFSARDLSDLEDQIRLLVARAQAESDFDLLG